MEYYKYETHLHTSEGSACAKCNARDMVISCKKAGYTGIIVTDHNWGGNTTVDRGLVWEEWVSEFGKGYKNAQKAGKEIGLDVFFAWEAGYKGTEFLIYGPDEEWLIHHPEIKNASIEEQFEVIHNAGGMVIHAHPFREESYISKIRLFPEYIDGVETINATHSNSKSKAHRNDSYNKKAIEYAEKYNLSQTAGSDIHSTDLLGGGMIFTHRLKDIKDFVKSVKTKENVILTDGETKYQLYVDYTNKNC